MKLGKLNYLNLMQDQAWWHLPAGSTRRLEASTGYTKDPVFKETGYSYSILDFTAIRMFCVLRMCFWRFGVSNLRLIHVRQMVDH